MGEKYVNARTWFWSLCILVLALDQASKSLIRNTLPPGDTLFTLGNFLSITHVENRGAAFGILQGAIPFFVITSILCVAAAIWLVSFWGQCTTILGISLGLVAGGALGNLVDRVARGPVTDFISLSFFPPVFNLADAAISVGALLAAVSMLYWPKG